MGIALVAYTLGTMSTLFAAADNKGTTDTALKQVNEKLDKIIASQEEMKSMLKRLYVRT